MITSLLKNLINLGIDAKTPTDTATTVRLVNTMSAVTMFSALILAPVLTYVTGKPILLPGYIEAGLFLISFWLNFKRLYFGAAILMLFTQNAAALYFGVHFGLFVPIVSLCIALGLTSIFLFQEPIRWLPGFLLSFLVINAVYFFEKKQLVTPWRFEINEESGIVYLANAVIYSLSAIVAGFYTKQIRSANRYKTKYLTKTNHEINRQVAALTSILDRLNKDKFIAETGKTVLSSVEMGLLRKYTQNIENIVKGGLQLIKIENGHFERANYESLELESLLADIKEEAEAFLSMKNLLLQFNVHSDVPKVIYTDRNKLGFILSNLVSNAVKFSHKNSSIIVNISKSEEHIIYQVLDFGKGMSRGKLAELFHRLFVTDENQLMQGNGIALPVIKEFVELLKGSINVDSEPGKGACFTVYLPHSSADEAKDQTSFEWDSSLLKGKKVIVVDDDKMGRAFMRSILQQMGGEVILCKDTLEAEQTFRSIQSDLIMMDVRLGQNVDGLEFIKKMKPFINNTLVIMHSSEDSDVLRNRIEEAGMTYLQKSLAVDQLESIQRSIRKLMKFPLQL